MSVPSLEMLGRLSDDELGELCQRIGRVRNSRYMRARLVSVEPFRQRYLALVREEGLGPSDLAARLGWRIDNGHRWYDGQRVLRTLGLSPRSDGTAQKQVQPKTAKRLADALGFDYHEVGI